MVWKSERWQSLVDKQNDEAHKDEEVLPGKLEITYLVPDSQSKVSETVYQDASGANGDGPRLLVPLGSVLKLKTLCEHEHAKYDEAMTTLKACRQKYYKELRWLRDQLVRANVHVDNKELEVYWFDPAEGVDQEAANLIEEATSKLYAQIAALQEEIDRLQGLLEDASTLNAQVKNTLRDYRVREVIRAIHAEMQKSSDLLEFESTCRELLTADQAEKKALQDELDALKERMQQDASKLAEAAQEADALRRQLAESDGLRAQLAAQAEELRLAQERAAAEAERADEIQKRVEEIERRNEALNKEIQASLGKGAGEKEELEKMRATMSSSAWRVDQTATNLADTLTHMGGSPRASPKAKSFVQGNKHANIDEALAHLDSMAGGVEDHVGGLLEELGSLRDRVGEQDALIEQQNSELEQLRSRPVPSTPPAVAQGPDPAELEEANKAARQAREERDRLESQLSSKNELIEGLRMQSQEMRQRFGEQLEALNGDNDRLRRKVARLEGKIRDLKAKKDLGDAVEEEEDEEDESPSPRPSFSRRGSMRAEYWKNRPSFALSERSEVEEALEFLGRGGDLGTWLRTALNVRKFIKPGEEPDSSVERSVSKKRGYKRDASSDSVGRPAWRPGGVSKKPEVKDSLYMSYGPYDDKSPTRNKQPAWRPGGASKGRPDKTPRAAPSAGRATTDGGGARGRSARDPATASSGASNREGPPGGRGDRQAESAEHSPVANTSTPLSRRSTQGALKPMSAGAAAREGSRPPGHGRPAEPTGAAAVAEAFAVMEVAAGHRGSSPPSGRQLIQAASMGGLSMGSTGGSEGNEGALGIGGWSYGTKGQARAPRPSSKERDPGELVRQTDGFRDVEIAEASQRTKMLSLGHASRHSSPSPSPQTTGITWRTTQPEAFASAASASPGSTRSQGFHKSPRGVGPQSRWGSTSRQDGDGRHPSLLVVQNGRLDSQPSQQSAPGGLMRSPALQRMGSPGAFGKAAVVAVGRQAPLNPLAVASGKSRSQGLLPFEVEPALPASSKTFGGVGGSGPGHWIEGGALQRPRRGNAGLISGGPGAPFSAGAGALAASRSSPAIGAADAPTRAASNNSILPALTSPPSMSRAGRLRRVV